MSRHQFPRMNLNRFQDTPGGSICLSTAYVRIRYVSTTIGPVLVEQRRSNVATEKRKCYILSKLHRVYFNKQCDRSKAARSQAFGHHSAIQPSKIMFCSWSTTLHNADAFVLRAPQHAYLRSSLGHRSLCPLSSATGACRILLCYQDGIQLLTGTRVFGGP